MNEVSDTELVTFDGWKPFSKSAIWQLQGDYFREAGIQAWSRGEVPHYITSNPTTGKTYAELVFAFLRDIAQQGATQETVYLLELGAGHGRFCYYFLKYFESLAEQLSIKLPPLCYILSDIAEANISFWQTHPRLQPYIEKGCLDFAQVDGTQPDEIFLLHSRKRLSRGSLRQPLVVVANYFFDSIPQELFYIHEKKLYQCQARIRMAGGMKDKSAAWLLKAAQLDYEHLLLDKTPYEEQYLNQVLEIYTDSFTDSYLLYPDAGMRCLHQLKQFSQHGVLLLTADKGSHRQEDVQMTAPPRLVKHGSFSLSVNYHAIKTYCEQAGGKALFPYHLNFNLNVGCLFLMPGYEKFKETQLAYRRFVHDFGPDEYYSLKKIINRQAPVMNFDELMGSLRVSSYDAKVFAELAPRLVELLKKISDNERWTVYQAIHKIWDNYYPLGEEYDLAFELGRILFLLCFFKEANVYFKLSVKLKGKSELRLYMIALCLSSLENYAESAGYLESALEINPDYKEALELHHHLKENKLTDTKEKLINT